MKKHLCGIIVLFCFLFIACTSNEAQLAEWVEKQMKNGSYPNEIEEGVWMDSVSVSPGLNLHLHFSFVYMEVGDFTPEDIKYMELDYKIGMMRFITSDDVEMKRFRNAGVTFLYEFRDMNGEPVLELVVTPEEYKRVMNTK